MGVTIVGLKGYVLTQFLDFAGLPLILVGVWPLGLNEGLELGLIYKSGGRFGVDHEVLS